SAAVCVHFLPSLITVGEFARRCSHDSLPSRARIGTNEAAGRASYPGRVLVIAIAGADVKDACWRGAVLVTHPARALYRAVCAGNAERITPMGAMPHHSRSHSSISRCSLVIRPAHAGQ